MNSAPNNISQIDTSRFAGLRVQAKHDPDAALKKVAREFEGMFVQMMLKAARQASPEGGLLDSNETQMYQGMFDDQVALTMGQQGNLGIEAMLRQQFSKTFPHPADATGHGMQLPPRQDFPTPVMPYGMGAELASGDAGLSPWHDHSSANAAPADAAALDERRLQFTNSLREPAERAAAKLGTTPEILIAQAALETGWGEHVMRGADGQSSNNLFSIKADRSWGGDTISQRTLEYLDGNPVTVNAGFRSYEGVGQAFDDYVNFISENPRYQQALSRAADPRAYVQALQRAGYATDPDYARKILQIHAQVAASTGRG